MQKPFRLILFITPISFHIFFGCASTVPRAEQVQPIAVGPEGTAPITFSRLIVRIPSGTNIGGHHDGLLKIQKFRHAWTSNITVASDEFKFIASEHLKQRGYTVMGGDNLLFGRDESAKADYQLGGTITSLVFNTYAPLAGNYSESSLWIEWQLYNALERAVVYTTTTNGYGHQSGIGNACIQSAFLSTLDKLLADSQFVAMVKKSPQKEWEYDVDTLKPIIISGCRVEQTLSVPKHIEAVLKSVIVIRVGEAVGSGVLISREGWALTAGHVVSGLGNVLVRTQSGLELSADVVRVDLRQDVALIRLPGRGYQCLSVADSSSLGVGLDLYAIGAPVSEELAFSVTKGVISGFRNWQGVGYIQTDAALNPGNSGGPLISSDGKIVGIVSWKIAGAGFEGLAFGVPFTFLSRRLGIIWE